MSGKTILLNGVSGSGKSTIIKTITDPIYRDTLNLISPANYRNGTTSTNVKYTFGMFNNINVENVIIHDFSDEWAEQRKEREKACASNNPPYNESYERRLFFDTLRDEFRRFIHNININFDDSTSRDFLIHTIKSLPIREVIALINKNKIDKYIDCIEINVPVIPNLAKVLLKHNLDEISIIDTKGFGQDDKSRNIDFSSVDGVIFVSDGSKLTDKYQDEIKEDFKDCLKSTPILIALRHSFDLPFENYSGFNNSLIATEDTKNYLQCLIKYCSNNTSVSYNEIKEILQKCGLSNNGFLRRIVDKYAFNALPQDYSKDNSMQGIYADKTKEFYVAAVIQMIDRCLLAVNEYKKVYEQASSVLTTQGQIINSCFTDVNNFGCEMVKQIDSENRLNAKILRAFPDLLGKYDWLEYAFNNDNYEKKRLRITLFNIVNLAIDYSLNDLVINKIITKNIAEILSVYFSIELKRKSEWVSMGYDRLGINHASLRASIHSLDNKEKTKNFKRLGWYYTAIHNLNPQNSCAASSIFELYLGLFKSLKLVKYDSKTLDDVMTRKL